mgnify:CR=1 FL=1
MVLGSGTDHSWAANIDVFDIEIDSVDTILGMAEGTVNPQQAFMGGKIQVIGDMALIMQMQAIGIDFEVPDPATVEARRRPLPSSEPAPRGDEPEDLEDDLEDFDDELALEFDADAEDTPQAPEIEVRA